MELPERTKIRVLGPVISLEKGTHKDLLLSLRKDGFVRVIIDDKEYDLSEDIDLEKNKKHTIEVVVDRLIIKPEIRSRLYESMEVASKLGHGKLLIDVIGGEKMLMSETYACPECDFSLPELEPRMFSFNAPWGACPECKGLGVKYKIDEDLIIPDKSLSINGGAISAINTSDESNITYTNLETACLHHGIDMNKPVADLTRKELDIVLYGSPDLLTFNYVSKAGNKRTTKGYFEGIITNLERRYMETKSTWIRTWIENYMTELKCPKCHGSRLSDDVLAVLIGGKNIYEVTQLSIKDLYEFLGGLKLSKEQEEISDLILKEIKSRLSFLINVGLEYLTLDREAKTLSGGEAQRIRLATQIGSQLTGVLYVLDEPSIGLHQRDNQRLINSLLKMRDLGNTLIVVEHDEDTIRTADWIVDVGPYAGIHGGQIVGSGTLEDIVKNSDSITAKFLRGEEKIEIPKTRRAPKGYLKVFGAKENNLKNINVDIPLGVFCCITGVSGSGKSSLINEIVYPYLSNNLNNSRLENGNFDKIENINALDKVISIDQSPIGRTPRSNPATYVGMFSAIRDLFASTPEAKARGYKAGRFSFNVKGGRCEACEGAGVKEIEMYFLPDISVTCDACKGKRYNRETLEVRYKGKNINDVLEMTVEEALKFFENIPSIKSKVQALYDVGLGYVKLGQSATELSGGEAQRVKLASELSRKSTGKTIYLLDEPTTGLHMYDVRKLIAILNRLVENGNSVVVIEHNLDVIKSADYIIDLGPEGGNRGGEVVAVGTPEEVAKVEKSYTGKYLKKMLN